MRDLFLGVDEGQGSMLVVLDMLVFFDISDQITL